MHPESAATAADVAAAGQNGVRSFYADVRLIKVQSLAVFYPSVAQALDMELVEQGETVVHVFERKICCGNACALVNLPAGAGGFRLHLIQRGKDAPGLGPARSMVEDVYGLLLHVFGPFRRGEQVGAGNHYRYVVVEEAGWLGNPSGGKIVFGGQLLGPVLGPVPLREK